MNLITFFKIRRLLALVAIVVLALSFHALSVEASTSSSSYDIVEIYKEVRVDSDAKVIDSRGDLQEVKKLLVPPQPLSVNVIILEPLPWKNSLLKIARFCPGKPLAV